MYRDLFCYRCNYIDVRIKRKENMEELLLKIKYSMTLDEIGEGFKLFQKKYQFKKSLVFTLVYLIALGLGIDFLIRDHTGIYGYILVGLSFGMIFYTWYKPVLIRKKLIATISSLAEETYTAEFYRAGPESRIPRAEFYRDRIQITTVIEEPVIAENETETEEETDSPAKDEPHEEEEQEEVVTNLYFGSDYLDAMENEQMFLLFVNRQNIYIFSKKCLSEEEQNKLREIFTEKSIL